MKNYTTLALCQLIGPVLGLLQAWPYLFDYQGSQLHNGNKNISIDDVRLTMNSFGLGETIGGLAFAHQVACIGYKRSQILMILINSLCFLGMSNNTDLTILYIINFVLGYTLASGITCVSFQCMTTYPDMGAVASGIGMAGFSLSASVWAISASLIINPNSVDPVDGFYPYEISQGTTLLFKVAFFFGIIMAVLCLLLLKDPESLKNLDLKTLLSFDTQEISKITHENKKIIEESLGEFYESFAKSINITGIAVVDKDRFGFLNRNILEDSSDFQLKNLQQDYMISGHASTELRGLGIDKTLPYMIERTNSSKILALARYQTVAEHTSKRKFSENLYEKNFNKKNSVPKLTDAKKIDEFSQVSEKGDFSKKINDAKKIDEFSQVSPEGDFYDNANDNSESLLKKDLESINEENSFTKETTHKNAACTIEEDVRTIRKTVRFWYYISFITLQYAAPYWHMMNMKSEGLKYHSEKFIINCQVYAPLFSAFGRVMGGVFINRLGLKKTYILQVVLNCITNFLFASFYDYKLVYIVCCYFFGFNMGVGSVCFFTTTIYIYGIDLSVRLSTWVSQAAPLSLLVCALTQKFVYPNFGLAFVEAEYAHLFLTMMVRINWQDP